jgi:hypothetical protein
MKVKELIAKLQEFDGELEVKMFEFCEGAPNDIGDNIEICYDDDFGTFVGLACK